MVYADPMGDVSGPLHAVGPKILDTLYRNDVRGPLQYCQAVVPAMMERGYGRIVTVAMDIGLQGQSGRRARSATQAALIGLTKAVAMSVVDTGILVNAVAVSDGVELTEGVVSTVCWLASGECSFHDGGDVRGWGRAALDCALKRLPACEAGVEFVPVLYPLLAVEPAEIDFAAVAEGGKVR